jgi:chemotaxis-related protein WspB
MLFLLFEVGESRYALDVRQITEVLPLVAIQRIPHAPAAVAGVFNCRGESIPVIDVCQLMLGRPAERRLSTRIVLVRYLDTGGETRVLGLIAERATRTKRLETTDFVASGVTVEGAPYLGPVAPDARGLLQWIDASALLTPSIREALFKQPAGA